MKMIDGNMKDFVKELGSSTPVPGGGGASALVAALAVSLGTMVANLTTGKKKYAQYQEEIEKSIEKGEKLAAELAEYMDKDAECFLPLSKAYGLPKDTPEQIEERNQVLEKLLKNASQTPLELMGKIVESMELLDRLSIIGSNLAISDVGVGIQFAKAALNGASLNVFINTNLMKNKEVALDMNQKADELLKRGNDIADKVYHVVMGKVRP